MVCLAQHHYSSSIEDESLQQDEPSATEPPYAGIVAGGVSSKGPYLILPNQGMTPVAQVGFT